MDTNNVVLKKLEIRAYRKYGELIEDRYKVAKELFENSKNEKSRQLARLEMIWIKLVKKEDFQKCIEECEKMIKSGFNKCPEMKFLVHFWLAFSLWSKTKHDLQQQLQETVSSTYTIVFYLLV